MSYRDYATVTIELGSIAGTNYGADAAYWQPDGHGSVWQDGTPLALWALDVGANPSVDWETIPWLSVACDQQSIETTTGFDPYGWNAEPGTLSAVLWDPQVIYSPIGPTGTGPDDIGIDMPIRIKATGPGKPWSAETPFTILWAGFIRRIVHSVAVNGQQVTTINATEVIGVYGRTNPVALTTPAPQQDIPNRTYAIHNRADKPASFPNPNVALYVSYEGIGQQWHPIDDLHDNVWQEMCAAINLHGAITAQSCYPMYIPSSGFTVPPKKGTPVATALSPWPSNPGNQPPFVAGRDGLVQVRPYCSDPAGPATPTTRMAISPTSLVVTHALDGIANYVDLAIAGVEGSGSTYADQASRDRWGTFTYTRHDLKMTNQTLYRDRLGQRILQRLKSAVYSIESMDFPVENTRDLACLVGAPTYEWMPVQLWWQRKFGTICTPGEWWPLEWTNPALTALLLVTKVSHSITAYSWKVNIAAEAFGVNDPTWNNWPDAVPKALELEAV